MGLVTPAASTISRVDVASNPLRANRPRAACRMSSAIGAETWTSMTAYDTYDWGGVLVGSVLVGPGRTDRRIEGLSAQGDGAVSEVISVGAARLADQRSTTRFPAEKVPLDLSGRSDLVYYLPVGKKQPLIRTPLTGLLLGK